MPFLSNLHVMLLDDRVKYPWILTAPLEFESAVFGEVFVVPKHFRTDGASVPKALMLLPVFGAALFQRCFANGVWLGFQEGVLHDWAVENMPANDAHRLFKEALTDSGYADDIIAIYYNAVRVGYSPEEN